MSLYPFLLISLLSLSLVHSCEKFDVRSISFTSTEAVLSLKTVVLVEGEAKCRDRATSALYAELNGILQPVSRDTDTDNFQVTFVFDHKDLVKGDHVVRFFNDKGFSAYLRAGKGGSLNDIAPIFTVTVRHRGIWYTPWVQSETIALLTIVSVALGAVYTKNKSF